MLLRSLSDRETERQRGREAERQRGREAERQRGRETEHAFQIFQSNKKF
jgi:hypothetical protein